MVGVSIFPGNIDYDQETQPGWEANNNGHHRPAAEYKSSHGSAPPELRSKVQQSPERPIEIEPIQKVLDAKDMRALRYSVLRGETERITDAIAIGSFEVNSVLDPNTKGRALHLAAGKGREAVSVVLLGLGADVNAKDKNGRVAADWAHESGFKELADLFQSHNRHQHSSDLIHTQVLPRFFPLPSFRGWAVTLWLSDCKDEEDGISRG